MGKLEDKMSAIEQKLDLLIEKLDKTKNRETVVERLLDSRRKSMRKKSIAFSRAFRASQSSKIFKDVGVNTSPSNLKLISESRIQKFLKSVKRKDARDDPLENENEEAIEKDDRIKKKKSNRRAGRSRDLDCNFNFAVFENHEDYSKLETK